MATRPQEPFIDEAIASIHAQTLPAERIIVVVNGPGAEDCDLLHEVAARWPDVELRTLAQPSMSAALADGFARVSTPFVAVLDADDLWEPGKQERQVRRLTADSRVDAVVCTAVNFSVATDGTVVESKVATGRMFGAVTFRTDVFARYGLPDAEASHFGWLYRWWSIAQAAGIVTESTEDRDLRRRLHERNGWVTDRAQGRQHLLAELRRISRDRRRVDGAAEANA